MSHEQPTSTSSLRDAIVTLPAWGIVMIAMLSVGSLVLAVWLAATTNSDGIKGTAVQLLVILIPLVSAVIASVAIRRTSTDQIDRLINGFLEKTVLKRFENWCSSSVQIFTENGYPFSKVELREPAQGRSYAFYKLHWRGSSNFPAVVGIKTNVYNFEVFSEVDLYLLPDSSPSFQSESFAITREQLESVQKHPVLSRFFGLIQGSVNEGYEVRIGLAKIKPEVSPATCSMSISIRQKVRENFLTSPFLKRYFAEDAVIAVGVLFSEYQKSGLMPPATITNDPV